MYDLWIVQDICTQQTGVICMSQVLASWLQVLVYSNEELYRSEAGIHFVDKL